MFWNFMIRYLAVSSFSSMCWTLSLSENSCPPAMGYRLYSFFGTISPSPFSLFFLGPLICRMWDLLGNHYNFSPLFSSPWHFHSNLGRFLLFYPSVSIAPAMLVHPSHHAFAPLSAGNTCGQSWPFQGRWDAISSSRPPWPHLQSQLNIYLHLTENRWTNINKYYFK